MARTRYKDDENERDKMIEWEKNVAGWTDGRTNGRRQRGWVSVIKRVFHADLGRSFSSAPNEIREKNDTQQWSAYIFIYIYSYCTAMVRNGLGVKNEVAEKAREGDGKMADDRARDATDRRTTRKER